MALKCRACRECNGIACRGEIPGVGGKGTGSSFIHNVEALARIRINMDVCAEPSEISTEAELLGMKLSMPVFAAPCAGIQNNYGDGIRGFTGDGIDPVNLFQKPAQAVNDHHGHGIVTIKPWVQEGIEERIHLLERLSFEAAAMDIDAAGLPLLRAGKTPVETKTAESLKKVKQALGGKPFIVKGIMTVHAAETAIEDGRSAAGDCGCSERKDHDSG